MPGIVQHSLAGRVLNIQAGRFARQAGGAVAVGYGRHNCVGGRLLKF